MSKLYASQKRIRQEIEEIYGIEGSNLVVSRLSIHIEIDELSMVIRKHVHEHNGIVNTVLQFEEEQARMIKDFLNKFYPD